ncbi:aldehyde dehydrogenase [Agromyces bracchium]|uniref:Aldehyde dehydrogenase family protein n=1 Tax=Agromyces bracchium TaxID=88376 RepID=A0A6I3MAX1_9MICO|nr:aldehyde dehydrogenase [Agromyces bracchium]MTH69282.1 aldehyde dehydrogenase family protein [Agromyces bracchium]
MIQAQMMIGGSAASASDGAVFDAVDPFDGTAWGTVPAATAADVDAAVRAAREAFPGWRDTPGIRRAELMHRLADAIEREADRLAEWESTDNGKVIRETRPQMSFVARNVRFFAGYADKLYGRTIPLDTPTMFDYTVRRPFGVCALITAWNSPLALLANKLPPALATGNTVVIKPSEHASITTTELARIAAEVGFPPGVINVVTGDGLVGDALTRHPDVDKISFTGGGPTGRRIASNAAERLVPVSLELGGKSPNIVFADADLDRAVQGAVAGIFGAAGQTCVAGSRLLVERSAYAHVRDAVSARARQVRLGDPRDRATEMGPVANRPQFERILSIIDAARGAGATATAGGNRAEGADLERGFFIEPTVFADVDPDSTLAQEEVFGPVLAIIPFDDEAEAIRIANGTGFGLAAGVWTNDLARSFRLTNALDAGVVWVNTYRASAAQAPFGGTKQSGYGRERGEEALEDYTYVKNVMVDTSSEARDPFVIRT